MARRLLRGEFLSETLKVSSPLADKWGRLMQTQARNKMQNKMQRGHVYKIMDSVFAIVSYYPETRTYCRVFADDVSSEFEACDRLAREFAGEFVVADSDTRKWGEQIVKRHGVYFGM